MILSRSVYVRKIIKYFILILAFWNCLFENNQFEFINDRRLRLDKIQE